MLRRAAVHQDLVLLEPARDLAEAGVPRLAERDEVGEIGAVVEHLAREAVHGVDDRRERLIPLRQPLVVRPHDDAAREQPRPGLAEEGGVGITPDAGSVLAHDAVGEGVVGRDARPLQEGVGRRRAGGSHRVRTRRRAGRASSRGRTGGRGRSRGAWASQNSARSPRCDERVEVREESSPLVLADRREAPLDPLGELAGGLAGEGEAEHLLGADVTVRDEPHDPTGHGLGLAAACAGDHDRRRGRSLDHGRLLGRRPRQAERDGDGRRGDARGSRSTRLLRPRRGRGCSRSRHRLDRVKRAHAEARRRRSARRSARRSDPRPSPARSARSGRGTRHGRSRPSGA